MSWMEQRRKIFNKMSEQLARRYEKEIVKNQECFKHESGSFFRLFEFPGENALCIEYAESYEEAQKNRFEDGDRFYIDEMDEEKMFAAMIKEIEDVE